MESQQITLKKTWFVKSQKEGFDIHLAFDFNKDKHVLGTGTYGSVSKAIDKRTKQVRAIKIIPKSRVRNAERFKTEIEILRNLDHPHIIKLFETFEDTRNIYLVMEMCEGGELFDRIINDGYFSEKKARDTFSQIMKAINYCHTNKICHRDLKPENFLFLTKKDDSPLKVIDFGLSKVFGEDVFDIEKTVQEQMAAKTKGKKRKRGKRGSQMKTRAGTPYYISPEVLAGDYDESCDIWSAGVILYIMLCGYPPFYGNTDREILDAVKKTHFDFDGPDGPPYLRRPKN